jgi:hypothetical protein
MFSDWDWLRYRADSKNMRAGHPTFNWPLVFHAGEALSAPEYDLSLHRLLSGAVPVLVEGFKLNVYGCFAH